MDKTLGRTYEANVVILSIQFTLCSQNRNEKKTERQIHILAIIFLLL